MPHDNSEIITHSDPVQYVDASDASHAVTPRNSSGRPSLPMGFNCDHFSRRWGFKSMSIVSIDFRFTEHITGSA